MSVCWRGSVSVVIGGQVIIPSGRRCLVLDDRIRQAASGM